MSSAPFRAGLWRAVLAGETVATTIYRRARQWLLGGVADLDPRCHIHPSASFRILGGGRGDIRVGANSHVRGELLVAAHGGRVHIGEWCYIGEGSRLWSASEIVVEDRVLVSHACEIHDWDAHPRDAAERHQHFRAIAERGHAPELANVASAPIRIREDAWIGFGATLLKGVTIGARSIVAARSLVIGDVPDDTIVAGVPAVPVRDLPRHRPLAEAGGSE